MISRRIGVRLALWHLVILLVSAFTAFGAAYLLLVDTLARTLSDNEVPLGILTAVVGAPFFLWLLARGRRGWA